MVSASVAVVVHPSVSASVSSPASEWKVVLAKLLRRERERDRERE